MKRIGVGVAAILGVLSLAGCTAVAGGATEEEQQAVQEWLDERGQDLEDPYTLAQMSAVTGTSESAPDVENVVFVSFEEPMMIGEVLYACTGPETMTLTVEVQWETKSWTRTFEDQPCGDDFAALDLPTVAEATAFRAHGSSTEYGAWSVIARRE